MEEFFESLGEGGGGQEFKPQETMRLWSATLLPLPPSIWLFFGVWWHQTHLSSNWRAVSQWSAGLVLVFAGSREGHVRYRGDGLRLGRQGGQSMKGSRLSPLFLSWTTTRTTAVGVNHNG